MSTRSTSSKTAKAKADAAFSRFIRLRDADENGYIRCYCCGKMIHWKQSQNMHFIPRQHMSLRFSEVNCHGGCIKCNFYDNGNIEAYTIHMKREYGSDIVEKLSVHKQQRASYSTFELEAIAGTYNKLANKIQREKGL